MEFWWLTTLNPIRTKLGCGMVTLAGSFSLSKKFPFSSSPPKPAAVSIFSPVQFISKCRYLKDTIHEMIRTVLRRTQSDFFYPNQGRKQAATLALWVSRCLGEDIERKNGTQKGKELICCCSVTSDVKWSESCSVVSDSLRPHGLYSPWNSPGQNTGVGCLSVLQGDLSNPGIELRSLALQADSLPAEPQGKPKNTGVGSLSLLQLIFPTQGSNWGLLNSVTVTCNSLQPHGLQYTKLSCPSLSPGVYSNSCTLSQWCHPIISSSATLFSFCLQSFQWVSSSHQVAKVLELQPQHQSFWWIFRVDFL